MIKYLSLIHIYMEIVGIFDVVADKDDQVNMYDDASYYAYSSYVFCSMDAAEGLIKGWGDVYKRQAGFPSSCSPHWMMKIAR